MGKLVEWVNSHSPDALPLVVRAEGGVLIVREFFILDGEIGEENIAIPATLPAARDFLGY